MIQPLNERVDHWKYENIYWNQNVYSIFFHMYVSLIVLYIGVILITVCYPYKMNFEVRVVVLNTMSLSQSLPRKANKIQLITTIENNKSKKNIVFSFKMVPESFIKDNLVAKTSKFGHQWLFPLKIKTDKVNIELIFMLYEKYTLQVTLTLKRHPVRRLLLAFGERCLTNYVYECGSVINQELDMYLSFCFSLPVLISSLDDWKKFSLQ